MPKASKAYLRQEIKKKKLETFSINWTWKVKADVNYWTAYMLCYWYPIRVGIKSSKFVIYYSQKIVSYTYIYNIHAIIWCVYIITVNYNFRIATENEHYMQSEVFLLCFSTKEWSCSGNKAI